MNHDKPMKSIVQLALAVAPWLFTGSLPATSGELAARSPANSLPRGEPIAPPIIAGTNPPSEPAALASQPQNQSLPASNHVSDPAPGPEQIVVVDGQKYVSAPFTRLASFRFVVSGEMKDRTTDPAVVDKKVLDQIPASVLSLNGQSVALTGFMVPTKAVEGKITEFMLLRCQLNCCYGVSPQPNEAVLVRATGKGFKAKVDVPIAALGKFRAGALRDKGWFVGIYLLECDQIVEARTLTTK
jgi:hypothetical protein